SSGPLHGLLWPPADKSISHRAALIAAMADGRTRISNFLDSADTRSTLAATRALGARIEGDPAAAGGELLIEGVGLHGAATGLEIDVGNAGTLLRLLPGWLAGQPSGSWSLDGDESIRRRPVDRVAEPLRRMGAGVECREERLPPLRIEARPLRAIDYEPPVASAQVKSCVLLAGLLADGLTRVREAVPTRDHTERLLAAAGAEIWREDGVVSVRGAKRLRPGDVFVPADFSSAAFQIAAALLVPGSAVEIEAVGVNPTRTGFLTIAGRMGAKLVLDDQTSLGGEPTATIRVRASSLRGTEVRAEEVPAAVDELPLVALLGCFAEGETVITGAAELRRKESDRIETVCSALRALGGDAEPLPDGIAVRGTGGLRGGRVEAAGDHRIAMLGAVAGVASREGAEIEGFQVAEVSYPSFRQDLRALAAGGRRA
ncbi:MAG TPA: 3-phosphoshikimate 1-carboxyvinyltransferase, partial [Solirubrobacterales bacterium]